MRTGNDQNLTRSFTNRSQRRDGRERNLLNSVQVGGYHEDYLERNIFLYLLAIEFVEGNKVRGSSLVIDPQSPDLLLGTLDMLILKAVSPGPLHGYGVLLRIQQISGEELVIQQGSLYPALYRLEHQGAITSEWGASENNRRAKYYRLTAVGRKRLEGETEKWNKMAGIIAGILRTTPESL